MLSNVWDHIAELQTCYWMLCTPAPKFPGPFLYGNFSLTFLLRSPDSLMSVSPPPCETFFSFLCSPNYFLQSQVSSHPWTHQILLFIWLEQSTFFLSKPFPGVPSSIIKYFDALLTKRKGFSQGEILCSSSVSWLKMHFAYKNNSFLLSCYIIYTRPISMLHFNFIFCWPLEIRWLDGINFSFYSFGI